MKASWRTAMACGCLAALGLMGIGGCAVHEHGQVDLVDVHGWHHQGYYDEHHDWHGGYYDDHHDFHEDPHDWRQ